MNARIKTGIAAFLYIFLVFPAIADVRLPRLISDAMVLQRDTKLKIWGWASPKESVAIKFIGKTYKTVTSADGKWLVTLPAIKSGGPYTMEITGNNQVSIKDILIGDVWFCSGQSNMVLPMERVKEKYPDEIAAANFPQIRNFFVPTASDIRKVHDDLPASKWVITSPETVLLMGATTYFFAKDLYTKYHVPIGIINSSVGGTLADAWVGAEGFKDLAPFEARVAQFRDSSFYAPPAVRQNNSAQQGFRRPSIVDKGTSGPIPWHSPEYKPTNWHKFWMPGYWEDQGVKNLHGVIWFRKEIDVPATMTGHQAKLFLGRIIDADEAYINGVRVGNITYQYPPRRYNVPANLLKTGKNLIVVRVTNTAGKGGFVPDKNYSLTDGNERIDLRGEWTYQVGMIQMPFNNSSTSLDVRNTPVNPQNEPTGLYNTMVDPATNYAIKGFLWYQGETNSDKPAVYSKIMTALIKNWRSKWNLGELPFIYAQLPNFMEVSYLPVESQWAEMREQQLQTLSVPNTAMAVTIELGEWNDIHPLNKKDVGQRMALAAEKLAYGNADVVYSGPIFKAATVSGSEIKLSFTNTGSGLVAKGETQLGQFAIAGADRRFIWANARIDGNSVIVWSESIKDPMYIRYAWADNPEGANLYNKEGLPASPFRTDKP